MLPRMRRSLALATWAVVSVLLATLAPDFGATRAEDSTALTDTNGCSGSGTAVFVEYKIWSECLSFLVLGRGEGVKTAIIFVGGDVPIGRRLPTHEMLPTFAEYSV